MATTFVDYTGDGNATKAFSFPSIQESDIKVSVDGIVKSSGTHYNITSYTTTGGGNIVFTSGNIPSSPAAIRIFRDTNVDSAKATYTAGSSVKAADLNANHEQLLFAAQEEQNQTVQTSDIKDGAVTSAKIFDGTIVNANINASAAIEGSKIQASSGSNAGTMSAASFTKLAGIETAATADQTAAEIRTLVESASDSNVFTDADHSKLNAIEAGATTDQTASEIKTLLQSDKLTVSEIADDAITTSKIQDAELSILAGMQSATASKLADSTALTADIADLNQIDGMAKQTTITDDDTKFPTSGAIVDYVAAQLEPFGGFEAIANESSFPNTQPASGVAISIADAGGMSVSGSGTASGATVGGTTVNISGIASNFHGSTVSAGVRFIVTSTGSGQNYTYHKATLKEDDLINLSGDINDFSERYRVGSSNPTSSLDSGDLFFNTSTGKLLVYNGTNTAWEEAQSIGNFFINTISSSSATGGGSATPNGTAYRFTLSNAGAVAQQHIVSVDGVIQKPNSGTSQPSEGFTVDGSDIIFGSAPVNGASLFVITCGSTVNVGTPGNNTVSSSELQNGSVTTAKIVDANVTTAKIANDAVTADKIERLSGNLDFNDSARVVLGNANDLQIYHNGSDSLLTNSTGDLEITNSGDDIFIQAQDDIRLKPQAGQAGVNILGGGAVELYYDNDKRLETVSYGTHTIGQSAAVIHNLYTGSTKRAGLRADNANTFTITDGQGHPFFLGQQDAQVELYYDNSKKLETVNGGARILGNLQLDADNRKAIFGSSNDLQIYHDGSHSYLDNATGGLYIRGNSSNSIRLQPVNGENGIRINPNSSVELYHDNVKKLETTSEGAKVTGTGANVLEIKSGSHELYSYQDSSGVGWATGTGGSYGELLYLNENASNVSIYAGQTLGLKVQSTSQELYYSGSKKFETTSGGVHVLGTLEADSLKASNPGNNALLIQNPSNGIIGFGANNQTNQVTISTDGHLGIPTDSGRLRLGASEDLQIYHNGTNSFIENTTGYLRITGNSGQVYIQSNDDVRITGHTADEDMAVFHKNGAVELYHDNSKKLDTLSTGTQTTGYHRQTAIPAFLAEHRNTDTHKKRTDIKDQFVRSFGVVRYNTGSHFSNSTGKFTAPVAGLYMFTMSMTFDKGDGTDDSAGCYFRVENNSANYNRVHNLDRDFLNINPRFFSRDGAELSQSFQTVELLDANATVGFFFTDFDDTTTELTAALFSGYLIG